MSDSDSDFCDFGLENNALFTTDQNDAVNAKEKVKKNAGGKRVRGKDLNWIEKERFDTIDAYKQSSVYEDIRSNFTCMRKRSPDYADTEHFICKFARKVGFLPCPVQYMVVFYSHNDVVSVACADGQSEHAHEVDESGEGSAGVNFKWTQAQTNLIKNCVQNEQTRPAIIRRNLENANLFMDGKTPSVQQLNNKIAHVKVQLNRTQQIFTTHDLRLKIEESIDLPDDETDAYIAFNEVIDENEKEEPRFSVIWTSGKMLKRTSNLMTQDDATYRLVWQG